LLNIAQAIELRQGIYLAAAALFFLLGLRFGILSSGWLGSMMAVQGAHRLTVLRIAITVTKATRWREGQRLARFAIGVGIALGS